MDEKNYQQESEMYKLLKIALDNQSESIKQVRDIVGRIENMQTESMLTIDESNKRMQETFNNGSKHWRIAVQTLVITLCLFGLFSIMVYFLSPFQVSSTAIATSTSSSESNSSSQDSLTTSNSNLKIEDIDNTGE